MQAEASIDYKASCEQKDALIEQMQFSIASLQYQLGHLKKLIYGSKPEKFIAAPDNPAQLTLDIQAEQTAAVKITAVKKIEYTRVTK